VGTGLLGAILKQVGLKYESMDIADDLGADHIGSVVDMPFADESFDVVGCFEVLEHIETPSGYRELARNDCWYHGRSRG